jgi:hypothetical protein
MVQTTRPAARAATPPAPSGAPWYVIAAALVAAGLFHIGVQLVRGGPLTGPVSWRKPADFGLSFGALLGVLTWLSPALGLGRVARAAWLSGLAAVCVVEEAGVAVQVWRGVPSHFNTSTPANSAVAMSLAAGGLLLVALMLTGTVAAFRPAATRAGGEPGERPARLVLPLADRLVARVVPHRRARVTPVLVGLYALAVAAVTAALLIQWPR